MILMQGFGELLVWLLRTAYLCLEHASLVDWHMHTTVTTAERPSDELRQRRRQHTQLMLLHKSGLFQMVIFVLTFVALDDP